MSIIQPDSENHECFPLSVSKEWVGYTNQMVFIRPQDHESLLRLMREGRPEEALKVRETGSMLMTNEFSCGTELYFGLPQNGDINIDSSGTCLITTAPTEYESRRDIHIFTSEGPEYSADAYRFNDGAANLLIARDSIGTRGLFTRVLDMSAPVGQQLALHGRILEKSLGFLRYGSAWGQTVGCKDFYGVILGDPDGNLYEFAMPGIPTIQKLDLKTN